MNPFPALLEVDNAVVQYAARESAGGRKRLAAVRGVSFQLGAGQIFGLVGESGCGKTSLARAIVGLAPLADGTIRFRGNSLAGHDAPTRRLALREIQYLFQDASAALSPRRTILSSLQEPLDLYRVSPRDEQAARIGKALEAVQLQADVLPRYPHELSGGQRQRVALARAVLAEPALLIADEPISSQDVSVQAHMISLLRNLSEKLGIAILLISHDLAAVQQLANRVGIMYLGEMLEEGPAASVLRHPAHPYTQALLAAVVEKAGLRSAAHPAEEREFFALRGEAPSALTPPAGCVFHTRCPEMMERCRTHHPLITEFRVASGQFHSVRCHLCES